MSQGLLFIVCGPSGVGKTSLCDALLEQNDRLTVSVSYTTRQARHDEVDGVDYHFVDASTFSQMKERGEFAEWAEVHGNCYGTPIAGIEQAWARDEDVLFDIDYQGARQLKDRFPGAQAVLVVPPDLQTLEARLRGRGTDSEDVIQRRLQAARHELRQFELFDFILENDRFETAASEIDVIYRAARHRTPQLREDLESMLAE